MTDTSLLLSDAAHARSGDKGNHASIAVLAFTPAGFDWLRRHLTAPLVAEHFRTLAPSRVVRFEAPNVRGLNFLLHDVLAGGASRSLRSDTQGKTLASALLRLRLPAPTDFVPLLRRGACKERR